MARAALLCIVPDGSAPTDGTQPRVAAEQPIEWPVGDSGDIDIYVQHADGTVYDLANCTLALVCRRHLSDPLATFAHAAEIDPTPQGGTAPGTATVTISTASSKKTTAGATYWFDVRLVDTEDVAWHVMPASKWIPTATVARAGEPSGA